MTTATQADYAATNSWTDLAATVTAAASVDVALQNLDTGDAFVFFGGGTAPTGGTGLRLAPGDSVNGNAANIWVKAADGSANIGVHTL